VRPRAADPRRGRPVDRARRARPGVIRPRPPRRGRAGSSSHCPASTTSTTRWGAAALARALGASLDEIATGLGRFSAAFGRFERIPVGDKRILLLLIKNPAGANEAVRTLVDGGAPRLAVVALNDAIADGRDVSWIWDVDFEPLLAGLDRVVATGDRAAELALRFAYGGLGESGDRGRAEPRAGARPRARAHARRRRARRPPHLHRDARPAADRCRPRPHEALLGADGMTTIRIGHLYPDYLNIYADRGNIAVLARRAALRGHELEVTALGMDDEIVPGEHDLYYVGGGQDREQLLVAENLAAKADPLKEAVLEDGAALLAVCGGYQLLGRGYRGFHGEDMPGVGLLPLETVAGERRMIGDVLLECELEPGVRHTLAGFENHAGRTRLDPGAEPLGRVLAGFGNDGESGFEGARVGRAIGTYLHGPLLPRNPWLADWLLAQALAHRTGGEPRELEPLADERVSGPNVQANPINPNAELLAEIGALADKTPGGRKQVAADWAETHEGEHLRDATDLGGLELLRDDLKAAS